MMVIVSVTVGPGARIKGGLVVEGWYDGAVTSFGGTGEWAEIVDVSPNPPVLELVESRGRRTPLLCSAGWAFLTWRSKEARCLNDSWQNVQGNCGLPSWGWLANRC